MFQLHKRLPKWRERFVKNGLKKKRFLSKSSKFRVVWTIQFCLWSKYLSNNVWRDFRLLMSALATAAGKSFKGKFIAKIDFSDRVFYITIADADIGSLKSLHTLFDQDLDHILAKFEQNCMVRIIQNLNFLTKNG